MQYEEFISQVQQQGSFASADAALGAIRITLDTLTERLTPDEGQDLLAQLPRRLRDALRPVEIAVHEEFGLDEFLRRVGEREGTDVETARRHAQAVLITLRHAIAWGETQDILAGLPGEYSPLLLAGLDGQLDAPGV
jgi:uncharacterized protein (DUF2267 family)